MLTRRQREILETIPLENNFSPLLHRIDQAVRWRAVNPDKPIPTLSERLTKLSNPPKEVLERAQKYLDRIMRAADVKKGTGPLPIFYSQGCTNRKYSTPKSKRPETQSGCRKAPVWA